MYSRAAAAAARAMDGELGRCFEGNSFCADFGESTRGAGVCVVFSDSWMASSPSFGRSDSAEPLFFKERAGLGSIKRASSVCRRAIWPFSSSSRLFQSGMD